MALNLLPFFYSFECELEDSFNVTMFQFSSDIVLEVIKNVPAWSGRHLLEGGDDLRYFGLKTVLRGDVEFECKSQREYDMWTHGVSRLLLIAAERRVRMWIKKLLRFGVCVFNLWGQTKTLRNFRGFEIMFLGWYRNVMDLRVKVSTRGGGALGLDKRSLWVYGHLYKKQSRSIRFFKIFSKSIYFIMDLLVR